jgi:hypothetical protein
MIKICRDCGREFDTENKKTICKAGYINQCAVCSLKSGDNQNKYLGKPGATLKGANIEIFRENLGFVRQVIKGENMRGPTANLNFSSPVNQSAKKDDM